MFTFVHMKKSDLDQSRLLSPTTLNNFLKEYALFDSLNILGTSVENRPIYSYSEGNGPKKVLIWSQMHGNESTTTKALVDFWLYLKTPWKRNSSTSLFGLAKFCGYKPEI